MEVKKIVRRIIGTLLILVPLTIFLFSDSSQYKQIGDTHFYLLQNELGHESHLYHDGGDKEPSYPIYSNGDVHDVTWNQQYIIIKCQTQKGIEWYILKNLEDYDYPQFNVKHYVNEKNYKCALDSMRINEAKMEHTDGHIPWSLHLW